MAILISVKGLGISESTIFLKTCFLQVFLLILDFVLLDRPGFLFEFDPFLSRIEEELVRIASSIARVFEKSDPNANYRHVLDDYNVVHIYLPTNATKVRSIDPNHVRILKRNNV